MTNRRPKPFASRKPSANRPAPSGLIGGPRFGGYVTTLGRSALPEVRREDSMQIIITRQGREEKKDFGEALVIGRSVPSAPVDLDLTPDTAVSRRHARIWLEG